MSARKRKRSEEGCQELDSMRLTLYFGNSVRQVAFSPDGSTLAVLVNNERAVRVWHLDRLGADPAISSSIFTTMITDVIGFLAFLGLAAWWLHLG